MRAPFLVSFGAAISIAVACGAPPLATQARPQTPLSARDAHVAWTNARDVFERRCVVCHGCYDAPCQLKLGTFDGIDRGATDVKVYDGMRLLAATPTRLGVDAHDTAGWRKLQFHPVLPEGLATDPRASVLVRMLDLKRAHPLTSATDVAATFTLDLDRKQTCTDAASFDGYAKSHPYWGMPYALPGLEPKEEASLVTWVQSGLPHDPPSSPSSLIASSIAQWETFLNEPSLKQRLTSRYLYEHLFLASVYFDDGSDSEYFRLVRSTSPSGEVNEIPTRRPFDDPKVEPVYYRFVRRDERPLEKTHMPYALNAARLRRVRELFVDTPWTVERLPSYEPESSANPFRTFEAIPAESRYRFMLEEAEFTLMGFIKGPVCRGQVALNVIQDRFWITFVNPASPWMKDETALLLDTKYDLDLPAESGSSAPPTVWLGYGRDHGRYVMKKNELLTKVFAGAGNGPGLQMIWDGDGTNANAALTVFRHFDSATVVKGLVGDPPKTAWVIDYPLLERIHYLLVAGFDVYGNVAHQLATRLYMDFLRMEGEANFLLLLPPSRRQDLVDGWYRGLSPAAKQQVGQELTGFRGAPNVSYRSRAPESELYPMLQAHLTKVRSTDFGLQNIADPGVRTALGRLGVVKGPAASWMPELSFVTVRTGADGKGPRIDFTITRDSAHSNVTYLFKEDDRRLKGEDELTVVQGFLGAYPNALYDVARADVDGFVDAVAKLDGEAAYRALRAKYGVLRTSDRFWDFADRMHEGHRKEQPLHGGLFDFNRLEAY